MPIGRTPLVRQLNRLRRTLAPSRTSSDRRRFLRTTAAASLGAALSGLRPAWAATRSPVHIVGGGAAGLTAAYRLLAQGREVHLHEAGTRFGGRIWTRENFNPEGMFIELGAEFIDTNHEDLIALAGELGVELQPLVGNPAQATYYHFGGRTYTDAELIPAFTPFAERIAADQGALWDADGDPTAAARALDAMSLADYFRSRGEGVAPWVLRMLEVAYVIEFGVDADRLSSLNFVDFIDPDTSQGFEVFGDSDEAFRLKGGNGRLCEALAKAIEGRAALHTGQRLSGIRDDGSRVHLTFRTRDGDREIAAEQVILALPFTMLREVAGWESLALSGEKKRVVRELGHGANVKAYHGFEARAWREAGPPCNGAVFTDLGFQNCWETSLGQDGSRGILCNFLGGSAALGYERLPADAFLDQLDRILPGLKDRHDGLRQHMNWPENRFVKASYCSPHVGQYLDFLAIAAEPALDGRLLFAGEHTSESFVGYMNGAVESGNRVAREAQLTANS